MSEGTNAEAGEDPYWHLHDEDFEAPFMTPRLTAEGSVFMGGRNVVSLNGDWRFAIDPMREGLRQRWFEHDDQPIDDWIVPRDYDEGGWQTTSVPGCWSTEREEWLRYEGAAWYSREFEAETPTGDHRVVLRIGAANERARVFLNGVFCGLHLGGSTPFFVDVTQHLQQGKNLVMIEVDSTRRADAVPMHHTDWFNHGGLYRDVELVTVPTVHISHLFVRLVENGVAVDVALSSGEDGTAAVDIAGLIQGRIDVRAGAGAATLDCAPELWSPDTPRLYDVTVSFGADLVADRVGFRSIERRGQELYLNGRPLRLRGIGVHEEDRDVGKYSNEADIRRRFAHLKDLSANIARAAHYPHHELVARIADEMGILLWEEIPVYWAIAFDNPPTFENARNQLVELIRRDANRASVILWGVGNENADTDARLKFMRGLVETARAEDPSRLVTAACLINRETFLIEDRLADHLDVIGLNQYFGWYEPGFEGLERLFENSDPDRPVVISETGADAVAGMHGPDSQLFTEEYQAKVLTRQVEIAAQTEYVVGTFIWLLYDFRTDRRQTRHQRGWNLKGVIAADKITRKLGFAALAQAYQRHFRDLD
ncbi:glycoside hydrolase family 2 protein [Ruegeria hyattellae]|uniref:glycoside hydrolase family 2 protein n=1 Tax=Ruegeria hyattellae TaxID=3233337 RepID=UPI00355C01E2